MTREELLNEAKRIITQDRQSSYGTPENNFAKIASLWSIYLGIYIYDYDVANLMILLKVARSLDSPEKIDHWVDIAGYAACGCEVATLPDSGKKEEELKVIHE
jgi:hypothetical protein